MKDGEGHDAQSSRLSEILSLANLAFTRKPNVCALQRMNLNLDVRHASHLQSSLCWLFLKKTDWRNLASFIWFRLAFVLLSIFRHCLTCSETLSEKWELPTVRKIHPTFLSHWHVFSATIISMCVCQLSLLLEMCSMLLFLLLAFCPSSWGVHYPRMSSPCGY